MIKNQEDYLYIGISGQLNNRIISHNTNRGANFTKNKSAFGVIFYEEYSSLKQARQREVQIKKWRRDKKEMLIKRFSLGLPTKQLNKEIEKELCS